MTKNSSNNLLKNRTVSGIFWKFAERTSSKIVSLIVSVFLARLLVPEDYSVVSIVTIFFAFANVLITSGFNTALIQKKNADIYDYTSVLYISIFISVVLYLILFFTAPLIASVYRLPILISVIRIMGIILIINAINSVLCAYVSRRLEFKKFFFANIGGIIVSAVVGIYMALVGYGAWALVAQQMTNSVIGTLILLFTTKLKLKFVIYFKRLKILFSYGWKMLFSALISVIYDEATPLVIGIKFLPSDLAYYSKGKSFPSIINSTLSDTFSSVLFPVMSKMQDNMSAVLEYTRSFIKIVSYLIFPAMMGFFAVSDTFISVVLTNKWLPISIYIRIFCLTYMFNIIHTANLQAISAIGRSDYILKMEIIKKFFYTIVVIIFVVLSNNPESLAFAQIVNTVIAIIVNTYPNRKLLGYKYRLQFIDILPNLTISIIMCIVVSLLNYIKCNLALLLFLQIVVGVLVYIALSIFTKNQSFYYLLNYIKMRLTTNKEVKHQ